MRRFQVRSFKKFLDNGQTSGKMHQNMFWVKMFDDFQLMLKEKNLLIHPYFILRTISKMRTDQGDSISFLLMSKSLKDEEFNVLKQFHQLGMPLYEMPDFLKGTVFDQILAKDYPVERAFRVLRILFETFNLDVSKKHELQNGNLGSSFGDCFI